MQRRYINVASSITLMFFVYSLLLPHITPLVVCFTYEHDRDHHQSGHRLKKKSSHGQLSPEMIFNVKLHGLLLWISMGFLMPVGILTIRISGREQRDSTRAKVFFYLHVLLQMLSVLIATAGAVMSLRNLENTFNNNHQRLGLVLYSAVYIQVIIGFFRPQRGKKGRKMWYVVHWILGTLISLVGIINIYTGLEAYQKKTLKSTKLWTILFTTQVTLIAFLYLLQDKREYMQKQGVVIMGNIEAVSPHQEESGINNHSIIVHQNKDRRLVPQPCEKKNALRNLFD